jgi:hypothetical protein
MQVPIPLLVSQLKLSLRASAKTSESSLRLIAQTLELTAEEPEDSTEGRRENRNSGPLHVSSPLGEGLGCYSNFTETSLDTPTSSMVTP